MATSLDMNTPEQTRQESNVNVNHQQYFVNKLEQQLVHKQTYRKRERDYGRIFREYNAPAQWYQSSPRSMYFYDPQYQRYLQQQSKLVQNIRPSYSPVRFSSRSPSRTKPTTTPLLSSSHQPKRSHSSRLQLQSSILPPITTHKQVKDE